MPLAHRTSQPPARNRVLEAALALFSEQGYFNTSVPDIVRRSGVSTGSIYHHFGDKQGIARALYSTLLEEMDAALATQCQQHEGARDRACAVIALLFAHTEAAPLDMAFMLSTRHREFMPDEPPICSSRPFNRMREIVTEGIASGEIRPGEPLVLAASLFGGALRLIQLRLDGLLPAALPQYLDETCDVGWRAVAA